MIPEDRAYTRNHEWVKLDGEVVQMGITAPLLESVGALISLEIPDPDDEMMLGVPFGAVEGMNKVHEFMPPADASVLEVNESLVWDLGVLAEDPYGKGWLVKIKVHDPSQLRNLLSAAAYREYCDRLKEKGVGTGS
jgi:glycine cleavage system H protein